MAAAFPPIWSQSGASFRGLRQPWRRIAAKRSRRVTGFILIACLPNQPAHCPLCGGLRAQGQWEAYMELLTQAFNPDTLEGLMCRSTLNVGYQGDLLIATSIKCWGSTGWKKTHLSLEGIQSTGPGCPSPPSPLPRLLGRCAVAPSPHR